MNNDKMIQFVKRWREIERKQKDLDFERSKLCRDIRAEFEKGARGDDQFANWCITELGLTAYGAKELLLRANAASVIPDERQWKELGGFRAVRPLIDLSRRDQVAVIEAAKVQSRSPINIMRERGLIQSAPTQPLTRHQRSSNSVEQDQDAEFFAQYIATLKNVPREVMSRVERYVGGGPRISKAA